MKPRVSRWQRPPIVLGFDLGPGECFPRGAGVNTRSAMLARSKHKGGSRSQTKSDFFFKKNNKKNFDCSGATRYILSTDLFSALE